MWRADRAEQARQPFAPPFLELRQDRRPAAPRAWAPARRADRGRRLDVMDRVALAAEDVVEAVRMAGVVRIAARSRVAPVDDLRDRLGRRVERRRRVREPVARARQLGERRVAAGVDPPVRPEQQVGRELVEHQQHDRRLALRRRLGVAVVVADRVGDAGCRHYRQANRCQHPLQHDRNSRCCGAENCEPAANRAPVARRRAGARGPRHHAPSPSRGSTRRPGGRAQRRGSSRAWSSRRASHR